MDFPFMKSLDQIAIAHETDKASVFTRTYAKPHDYCRHYEQVFEPVRNLPIRLIEVGVGGGESIQTWLEYFPNALIYGVDINSGTNEWNEKPSLHGRYEFVQGDQSSEGFWAHFIEHHVVDLDIVIDDGSHVLSDIMTTFNALWPHIVSGGLYAVEDLTEGHAGWLGDRMRVLNMVDSDCDSIHLSRQLAIFRKR